MTIHHHPHSNSWAERRNELGMTTAEYAVGTLGACSVAAVLIKLAQSPWFGSLIKGLLKHITGIAGY